MEYKYCSNENFEDLACGRVLHHKAGMSNFPVRLAQEIFKRCLSHIGHDNNVSIYDPCCGSGYLLTVLGLLNGNRISRINGSDIDGKALNVARNNFSLLTPDGLNDRLKQLEELYMQYGKASHKDAIESAKRLMAVAVSNDMKPETCLFQADILSSGAIGVQLQVDIVITDVPYGNLASWQGESENAINRLLTNLIPVLKQKSVIAVCSDKRQKIKTEQFVRLEKQSIGKRKFEIFTPLSVSWHC